MPPVVVDDMPAFFDFQVRHDHPLGAETLELSAREGAGIFIGDVPLLPDVQSGDAQKINRLD